MATIANDMINVSTTLIKLVLDLRTLIGLKVVPNFLGDDRPGKRLCRRLGGRLGWSPGGLGGGACSLSRSLRHLQ